jgi:hypothetical protein
MGSSSYQLSDGTFEITGLVNGEKYFIGLWAEGYPDQFWSVSGKNTSYPAEMMTLDVTKEKLQFRISKTIEGSSVDINRYISIFSPVDSNGIVKIKWTAPTLVQIDTFFVYARNKTVHKQLLATIPHTTGAATYEELIVEN